MYVVMCLKILARFFSFLGGVATGSVCVAKSTLRMKYLMSSA